MVGAQQSRIRISIENDYAERNSLELSDYVQYRKLRTTSPVWRKVGNTIEKSRNEWKVEDERRRDDGREKRERRLLVVVTTTLDCRAYIFCIFVSYYLGNDDVSEEDKVIPNSRLKG